MRRDHANIEGSPLPFEEPSIINMGEDTGQFVLAGCRRFGMRSLETGLEYEIFTYIPEVPPPPMGFPVIYVMDANSDFVTVAETVRRVSRRPSATGIGPSIIVGIGYPNTRSYDLDRRYFDFTRTAARCATGSDVAESACGGQSSYIRFLSRQLLPHISDQFRTNPHRHVLLGHSLAGYFVLDLLAQFPGLFDGYISFSPSVWWDRPGLAAGLKVSQRSVPDLRLYVAVGRFEQEFAPWQMKMDFNADYQDVRAARKMIDNARDVAKEIEVAFAPGAQVKFEVGEQEDHSTIVTTMLCRALRFVTPSRPHDERKSRHR